jgi:uncharacterized protein YoxC
MNEENVMDDLDALGALLDDDGEDGGNGSVSGDGEEPAGGDAGQDSDRDGETDDLEDEGDEEGDADEDEADEEEEAEADVKTVSAMQRRIDKLTFKSKSAEERAAKLEAELEAAEAKLQQVPSAGVRFASVNEVDERMEKLADQWIPKLEDLVEDAPLTVTDEVTGESRDNMVDVNGKSYAVREVKDMLKELRLELRTLPKERARVAELAKRNEEGRKILPDAWRRGTVADTVRRELLREVPELVRLGDSLVARAVLGQMALKQHEERKARMTAATPKKTGLKSSAKTHTAAKGGKKVHLEGLEPELAKLAGDLGFDD